MPIKSETSSLYINAPGLLLILLVTHRVSDLCISEQSSASPCHFCAHHGVYMLDGFEDTCWCLSRNEAKAVLGFSVSFPPPPFSGSQPPPTKLCRTFFFQQSDPFFCLGIYKRVGKGKVDLPSRGPNVASEACRSMAEDDVWKVEAVERVESFIAILDERNSPIYHIKFITVWYKMVIRQHAGQMRKSYSANWQQNRRQ